EHDLSTDSVCEAEKSYPIMRAAGFTPLTIADCLGDPNWYVEGPPPAASSSVPPSSAAAAAASSVPGSQPNVTINPGSSPSLPPSAPYPISPSALLGIASVLPLAVLGI